MITTFHELGSNGLRPDLTILVEVNADQTAARLAQRDGDNSDAIGGRDGDYHARVAQSFRDMAAADPDGFALIDGSGAPDEVHKRIMAALDSRFGS
jgi:dTMP kinase